MKEIQRHYTAHFCIQRWNQRHLNHLRHVISFPNVLGFFLFLINYTLISIIKASRWKTSHIAAHDASELCRPGIVNRIPLHTSGEKTGMLSVRMVPLCSRVKSLHAAPYRDQLQPVQRSIKKGESPKADVKLYKPSITKGKIFDGSLWIHQKQIKSKH